MDYQGDMGGGGGGYDTGGGGFNGGGTPRARKSYDEQTLIPVTARMILHSSSTPEGTLALLDGRELHHVKYIGAVRSFEDQSTNVTFSIEDGTGLVDVKQWIDANDCTAIAEMRQACQQEHVYVKVIGQVKDYDGRKTLVAHTIRRLGTTNELTHHMLEVVYSAEKFQKKDSIVGGVGSGAIPMGAGGGVGFGGGVPVVQATGNYSAETGVRDEVLNFIRNEGSKTIVASCIFQDIHVFSPTMLFQTKPSMAPRWRGVFSFSRPMERSRNLRFAGLSKVWLRKAIFIPPLMKITTALPCNTCVSNESSKIQF